MNDFHFLRHNLLWFIFPFLGLLWLMTRSKQSESIWNKICSKDLLPYILVGKSKQKDRSYLFILLTLSLLVFALAGPTWKMLPQMLFKPSTGLVIALDLSPTMDAGDIKPSRLKRAIYKINDFLNLHKDGQTALLVFSGDPYVVTPLTDDLETIKTLLPSLDTSIMPSAGHSVSKAISKANDLLTQAGISDGSILLVTSELSNEELGKAIKEASKNSIRVSVLGVGTNESVPIPKPNGGFLTNTKGAMIIATLASENLNRLAKSTGGKYIQISVDDEDIHTLNDQLANAHKLNSQEEMLSAQTQWHDQGYLFVLLALPFASLLFRRGLVVLALLIIPQTLQAFSWNSLWQTPDQQAEQLFHQENYQEAKDMFQDPEWLAAANYKLEDYESAANLLEKNESVEGLYNYGTSKAKQGDFEAALNAYNQVLEKQPDHEDALHNKNLIENFQKEQNKEDKKDSKNKKQNNDQKSEQNKKDQDNKAEDQENSDKDESQENNDPSDKNDSEKNEKDDQKSQESDQENDEKSSPESQSGEDQKESEKKKDSDQSKKENSKLDQDKSKNQNNTDEQKPSEEMQKQYHDQVEEQMQQKNQSEDKEDKKEASPQKAPIQQEMTPEEQQRKIDDRWLQRIPDDPGGLLRRKFQYQYKKEGTNK